MKATHIQASKKTQELSMVQAACAAGGTGSYVVNAGSAFNPLDSLGFGGLNGGKKPSPPSPILPG